MKNSLPAICARCGAPVAPGAGVFIGQAMVAHRPGSCPKAAVARVAQSRRPSKRLLRIARDLYKP